MFSETFSLILGIGSILLFAGCAWFSLALFFKGQKPFDWVFEKTSQYALPKILAVSLVATIGSLIYSNVIGFEPCNLCWYQRIFLYPIPIIAAIAWYKKDLSVFIYVRALAIFGGLIAIYHTLLQMGFDVGTVCSAGVSCAKVYVAEFGFITIPLMSLLVFLMVFILTFFRKK